MDLLFVIFMIRFCFFDRSVLVINLSFCCNGFVVCLVYDLFVGNGFGLLVFEVLFLWLVFVVYVILLFLLNEDVVE